MTSGCLCIYFFFFNDTATTEIYTLSLHDALPISIQATGLVKWTREFERTAGVEFVELSTKTRDLIRYWLSSGRSEEHTSELQSQSNLVCRLLLEKKKKNN